VVYFLNVNIQVAKVLKFKARVSLLILEYPVKIQLEKLHISPSLALVTTSIVPVPFNYFNKCAGALDGILLKIYAVDLRKGSYKTNLTEDMPLCS
jgi:hypothetical protein